MSKSDRIILAIGLLVLTIAMVWAAEGDITIACLTVPLAILLVIGDVARGINEREEFIDSLWEEYREDETYEKKDPQLFDLKEEDAA